VLQAGDHRVAVDPIIAWTTLTALVITGVIQAVR
jgi:hypothetical protein